jgi:hypothetical protein
MFAVNGSVNIRMLIDTLCTSLAAFVWMASFPGGQRKRPALLLSSGAIYSGQSDARPTDGMAATCCIESARLPAPPWQGQIDLIDE